jgi:hypothetical protein
MLSQGTCEVLEVRALVDEDPLFGGRPEILLPEQTTPKEDLVDFAKNRPFARIHLAGRQARRADSALRAAFSIYDRDRRLKLRKDRARYPGTQHDAGVLPNCRSCGNGTEGWCDTVGCDRPTCNSCERDSCAWCGLRRPDAADFGASIWDDTA